MENGVAVSRAALIEVDFSLLAKGRGALREMTFERGAGVSGPWMTAADLPPAFGIVEVQLEFTVNEQGDTKDYKLTGTMPGAGEQKLLFQSIGKWKFRPALRDGQAAAVGGKVIYYVK